MFYQAYELFDNGKYHECLPLFLDIVESPENDRFLYWSLIFSGRCIMAIGNPGAIEFFKRAMNVFPDRAEAIYETGNYHYINGNHEEAERLLKLAANSNREHRCIRYEAEKYFEAPYELLIEMYMWQNRFNDVEELVTTLQKSGRKNLYDAKRVEYYDLYSRHYNNSALEFVKAKTIQHDDTLVIQLPTEYDGLGDNLVFSHIPRIAKESGKFKQVFISSRNSYKGADYADIIWGTNPYVDGFVDLPGTYSSIQMNRAMDKWYTLFPSFNLMDSIMFLHDLDDGTRGNMPECYYKPNKIESLEGKTVLDVGAKTMDLSQLDVKKLMRFLQSNGIVPDYVLSPGNLDFEDVQELKTSSIQHWADIMYSAKNYVCFNSGGYWLSAALGIKAKHIWVEKKNLPCWSYLNHENIRTNMSTIYREDM